MYRCKECGGVFPGGHFCVGPKIDGLESVYKAQKTATLEDPAKENDQYITITLEEYMRLKTLESKTKGEG